MSPGISASILLVCLAGLAVQLGALVGAFSGSRRVLLTGWDAFAREALPLCAVGLAGALVVVLSLHVLLLGPGPSLSLSMSMGMLSALTFFGFSLVSFGLCLCCALVIAIEASLVLFGTNDWSLLSSPPTTFDGHSLSRASIRPGSVEAVAVHPATSVPHHQLLCFTISCVDPALVPATRLAHCAL